MRSRQDIEREMFNARENLEQSVNELRHVLAEKLAIKARAHHAIDERVDQVKDVVFRTRDGAVVFFRRARDKARQHTVLLGVVLGGVVALTLTAVFLLRRRRRVTSR